MREAGVPRAALCAAVLVSAATAAAAAAACLCVQLVTCNQQQQPISSPSEPNLRGLLPLSPLSDANLRPALSSASASDIADTIQSFQCISSVHFELIRLVIIGR